VLLVAGMLSEQQFGDHGAALQRGNANNKQLTAVEALRAAVDLENMRVEAREIRLAIAPSEVDRALERLHAQVLSSAQTLAQDGCRLSAEMEKFLVAVCAA
jgi:hypothetical protein